MWKKCTFTFGLGTIFYLPGLFCPSAVLLDMPFGLGFYFADLLGWWEQGLMWAVNHRFLAILCFFGWPLFVSMLLSYIIVSVILKLWSEGKRFSHLYAIVFLVAVFGLILTVRVTPASYFVSYFGYWVANY
jgi:hypothetical protein